MEFVHIAKEKANRQAFQYEDLLTQRARRPNAAMYLDAAGNGLRNGHVAATDQLHEHDDPQDCAAGGLRRGVGGGLH